MRGITRVRAIVVAVGWSLLALGGGAPATAASPGVATMSAGGDHACAVRTDGTVWCWGDAKRGQLGDGTTGDPTTHLRTVPVQVLRGSSTLKGVTKIAAGSDHTCAVRTDHSVWCWGDDSSGQLGDGTTGDPTTHLRTKAVQVLRGSGTLTGAVQVTAGDASTCALRSNGSVLCWGLAKSGQVGDGTTGDPTTHLRTTAVRVRLGGGFLGRVEAIAAGDSHTCAVREDGSVWCWGDGQEGQLGDGGSGSGHDRTKAVHVKRGSGFLTKVAGIAGGAAHTCARRTDGSAWCWGFGENGELGDGTTGDPVTFLRTKPVQVLRGSGTLTGVTGIGSGSDHTCVRRTDGSAWCWGFGASGELGDGTTGDSATHLRLKPVRVIRPTSAFTGVRKLDGGGIHTCALRNDQTVWCWGNNQHGQLGRGTSDANPHPFPLKVLFP